MSYLVIIRGPLGVGKTTIAKKLTVRLEGKYFSVDKIGSYAIYGSNQIV